MSVYANYGITFQLKYTKYIMYLYTVACLLYQNHNRTLIILVVLEIEKKKCKITCTCNVCQRFFLFIYDFFKLKNNCINCLSTLYQIQEMQIFTFEKKNSFYEQTKYMYIAKMFISVIKEKTLIHQMLPEKKWNRIFPSNTGI